MQANATVGLKDILVLIAGVTNKHTNSRASNAVVWRLRDI